MPLESTILYVCNAMMQFDCTCDVSTNSSSSSSTNSSTSSSTNSFGNGPLEQHHIPMDVDRDTIEEDDDQSSDVEIGCSRICLQHQSRQISVSRSDMLKMQATMYDQRTKRPSFVFVENLPGASVPENTVSYWYDLETLTLLWLHKRDKQVSGHGPQSISLQACNRECVRCHVARMITRIGCSSCTSGAMTVYHVHSPYRESLRWNYKDEGFSDQESDSDSS